MRFSGENNWDKEVFYPCGEKLVFVVHPVGADAYIGPGKIFAIGADVGIGPYDGIFNQYDKRKFEIFGNILIQC